jgi:hypothetical protein
MRVAKWISQRVPAGTFHPEKEGGSEMPVCRLLALLATLLAIVPASAADVPERQPERVRATDPGAGPKPAAVPGADIAPGPARKEKRVRQSFPAPKRMM